VNVANRVLGGAVTFVTVVEAGSFRSAARVLDITPSGVSRAVARLEEQLGVRLFHRHPRAVALTDEGQRFHDEIRPLVDGISRAAETAQDSSGHVTGRLKIQCCPPFGHYVLVPSMHTFLEHHPALSVDIEIRDQLGDLVGESFDLAVRFGKPEPSSLVVRKLTETEVLTCAAPRYIEKHGMPDTPVLLQIGRCRAGRQIKEPYVSRDEIRILEFAAPHRTVDPLFDQIRAAFGTAQLQLYMRIARKECRQRRDDHSTGQQGRGIDAQAPSWPGATSKQRIFCFAHGGKNLDAALVVGQALGRRTDSARGAAQ
jgi:DNA-binding transcriptional LysR family regulator